MKHLDVLYRLLWVSYSELDVGVWETQLFIAGVWVDVTYIAKIFICVREDDS